MPHRIPTAVLISGRGSNLGALIAAAKAADFPASIALVISNRADAYGIVTATDAGIPVKVVDHTHYASRETFERALDDTLTGHGIELVCLAGFMRILTTEFVREWEGRLMNIHPSLLPKYRGLNTHARVLADGGTRHGATVHWVTHELDAGEIILQEALDVLPVDTAESLAARVQEIEHRLYPAALKQGAENFLD